MEQAISLIKINYQNKFTFDSNILSKIEKINHFVKNATNFKHHQNKNPMLSLLFVIDLIGGRNYNVFVVYVGISSILILYEN